jgi:hypothetical protein
MVDVVGNGNLSKVGTAKGRSYEDADEFARKSESAKDHN